jgi:hypothetical protein
VTSESQKTVVEVEELGGFVGFSPTSHVRTRGEIDLERLPEKEQAEVRRLLKRKPTDAPGPGPRYLLSWVEDGQPCQVEIGIEELTPSLRASLKTDLV